MPPEIMKVENYDYKTEGLQEQNKLEPRNALADNKSVNEITSVSEYLRTLGERIEKVETGLLANNNVDEKQKKQIIELQKNAENTRSDLKDRMVAKINGDPVIGKMVHFFEAGDPRWGMINDSEKPIEALA